MAVFPHIRFDSAVKTASLPFEAQPVSGKLLVYLFHSGIQEQVEQFYAPYYTVTPTVAYYFTTVTGIREEEAGASATFTTFPYLGPHDTVGTDEVTFYIDRSGTVTDTQFRHLQNDSLPANLSHLQKGLPPVSE